MTSMTLSRYFAQRFFVAVVGVFLGVFVLVTLVDYIELMRKAADLPNAPAMSVMLMSFYRVPQTMERLLPFSVLVGAMTCFLGLSRRMELVVARGAGMSVWQIIAPAMAVALLVGAFGTLVYNPAAAYLREASKRIEAKIFGQGQNVLDSYDSGYWVRQRGNDGESILNARQSENQGLLLTAITIFTFNAAGEFKERIEADEARLQPGAWQLRHARIYVPGIAPQVSESVSAADQADARAGGREFCGAGYGRILAFADLYPLCGRLRPRCGGIPGAVSALARAAVPARGNDSARIFRESAIVSVRRRAAARPRRRRRGVLHLCALQGDGGFEPGGIALSPAGRLAADRGRRADRVFGAASRRGWLRTACASPVAPITIGGQRRLAQPRGGVWPG